ncbi:MAG: MFS transporter [Promethearchaeota archaeon]
MQTSSTTKNGLTKKQNNAEFRSYRFFPLFAMCFLRTFFYAIYSLALPNILIFEYNFSSGLVGTISSVGAIAYIMGPFFGRKVTEKFGIKKTLIYSQTIGVIAIIISIIYIDPVVLIIMRAIDGFLTGFFWPNAFNLITSWEKSCKREKKINFLRYFNFSWNFGLIGGFLAGYIIVLFLGQDFIALIVSAFFASLIIPSAFLLEKSEDFEVLEDQAVVFQDLKLRTKIISDTSSSPKISISKTVDSPIDKDSMKDIPIILAWGGILLYASTKSIFRFTIPYFFKFAEMDSYWVYVVVLFQQVFQIIGLSMVQKFKKQRFGYFIGVFILIGFTLSFLFNPSIWVISIINIISGFCIGLVQGVTQRLQFG